MKDRVIFKKWRNGDIIACLPDSNTNYGRMMMYEHIGQHGEGDYYHVLDMTTPAQPEEYANLLAELTSIGYNPVVTKRYNR
jgi:hypothetical protein